MKIISNNKLMKNTKKQINTNKKTMRGKGIFSSYKAPTDPITPPESATDGQDCQAQLLNKDGKTQARKGIECTDGTVCQTKTGAQISSSKKAYMTSWGQKDVTGNYMGKCGDPTKVKGITQRAWNATKNTVQGTANATTRMNELGKMCGFIPSIQITESGLTFNKNLWRNLKRNMAILASIPSDQLETLLNTPQSKSDYENLSTRLEKHGINLDANNFSEKSTTQANTNEDDGESAPLVQSQSSLPPGWKSAVDPTSSKTYYISPNGQTQWEPPTPSGGEKRKNKSKKNKRNKSRKHKKNLSKKRVR